MPPIVHHLADIAASKNTRQRIGALIKREVDDYYERLSFIKKIFISRDRIYYEVDDLVNNNLPRRVEEYLRGEAFAQEATVFLNETIDNLMHRPLNDLLGQISSDNFENIKRQATERFIAMLRSPELVGSINVYLDDALQRLQPRTLRELLETLNPDSAARAKTFLTKSLLTVLARDDTAKTINGILSAQIEKFGDADYRLADHMPPGQSRKRRRRSRKIAPPHASDYPRRLRSLTSADWCDRRFRIIRSKNWKRSCCQWRNII